MAPPGQVLDDPRAIRQAGRELLSLALIDSRNHLLRTLADLMDHPLGPGATREPRRLALQAAWYQEYWIARHVQRQRGPACDPAGPRLGGIEPDVDQWLAPLSELPDATAVRAYLAETLEVTLDLLAGTPDDDAPLHFFRQVLLHEDRLCEALTVLQQRGAPPARPQRPPVWVPAQRWSLGQALSAGTAGWMPHNERGLLDVAVPEFEIDAQPVNWAQYIPFAEDGGYDRRELWTGTGWDWLQTTAANGEGRRAPRHVAQLAGGVLVQRGAAGGHLGQAVGLVRAAGNQAALHVTRFEAEAWCNWAGRRLPTEPEWELAASTAASRGFVWGDVFEWVAGSARAWPGAAASAPGCLDAIPPAASQGVLRGASFATRSRRHHPQARRFAPPGHDRMFCGFRSCAP